MRRRRWPARAAALCLAVVVLQLAADSAAKSLSKQRAHGPYAHMRALPAGAAAAATAASLSSVGKDRGGRTAAFDAAAGSASSCKRRRQKSGGGRRSAAACSDGDGGDDDDKRVVPTGPNPLHNRNKNCPAELFLNVLLVSTPEVEDSAVHHV
ncbi:hypothetical protein GUJ93_ZPchr0006g42503 [Zizania palustris]|uniref:Uncharacterized protein n=1 Tax=Zizania palustris TaxID=103762 RepID=A0A8J5SKQ5_ZIZPA|nr:hypothetical protein GUJ93_ZPchr0006g42503 [Zizania palustris]